CRPRLLTSARPSGGALSRPRFRLPHWDTADDASDQQSDSSQTHWTLLVTETPTRAHGCSEEGVALLVQYVELGASAWRATSSGPHSCEAEIYAGAMAAQELRWLTYLLADLGESPRSPPVLYVDNKAMLALCREYRLEHRTKHIALRYFLARELQQCGQLHLAYVASEANTADIFTKALPPGDHQRFCTMLGLVPTWPHLLTS
ncbi:unnamed protein product, partial [Closterium sp. NIES-53]